MEQEKQQKHTKSFVVVGVVILIILLGALALAFFNGQTEDTNDAGIVDGLGSAEAEIVEANRLFAEDEYSDAAVHARRAIEYGTADPDLLMAAADVITVENVEEAQILYAQVLDNFIKDDSPEAGELSTVAYWARGNLAELAGKNDVAVDYYQKAVDVFDPLNEEAQSFAEKSQDGLERLK